MNSEQQVGKRGPVHSNRSKVSKAGLTPSFLLHRSGPGSGSWAWLAGRRILSEQGPWAIHPGCSGLSPGRTLQGEEDHCLCAPTNVLLPRSLDPHPVIIGHPLGPSTSSHR